MQVSDHAEIIPIINHAYSYIDKYRGKPRTNPEHLREHAGVDDYYVVEDNSKLEGCVYIHRKGDSMHFGMLALTDNYRGKGVGQAIINAIEDYAKELNCKTLEIDYMSVSPWLKKYYESKGYRETGQIEQWGKIDLIHMSKDLKNESDKISL